MTHLSYKKLYFTNPIIGLSLRDMVHETITFADLGFQMLQEAVVVNLIGIIPLTL